MRGRFISINFILNKSMHDSWSELNTQQSYSKRNLDHHALFSIAIFSNELKWST